MTKPAPLLFFIMIFGGTFLVLFSSVPVRDQKWVMDGLGLAFVLGGMAALALSSRRS